MVRLRNRFWMLAGVAGLLCTTSVAAQVPGGRITGTVRDSRGTPIQGATVSATSSATGTVRRTATAADGRYTLTGITAGSHTVAASIVGYQRGVRIVQVANEATVDFALDPLPLAEVTVTATLREQELSDVPFSVAAPTAQVLRDRGVEDIEGVARNVAGFTVQNLGPGQSQPAMRGTSAGQIARDQPGVKEEVGSYLDDVPISLSLFTPDLDLFDVSRVEVLRGPQGTLFGAGSLSGTVRYISNQPELGLQTTFGELGAHAIDNGSAGGTVKLGANVPFGDRAAGRIAGYFTRFGGYMDEVQPDFTVKENANSGTRAGARAALRFAPGGQMTITPRIVYQQIRMDGWNRVDAFNILANPYTLGRPRITLGERQLFTQIEEPYDDDFVLGDVNIQFNLGPAALTSVTSYSYRDILVTRDATALTGSITGSFPLTLPASVFTLDAPLYDATTAKVWTQELRLAGSAARTRWLLGGFYSGNKREYGQSLFVAEFDQRSAPILGAPAGFTRGLRAAVDELYYSDLSYDLQQFAVFGEATLSATERLDLTAGLRYYNFDEDREQIFDGIFANDDTGTDLVSVPGKTKSDGFAPRFSAALELSDRWNMYAQAARGFRLGGINDPINEPLCTPEDLRTFGGRDSWTDETAWNYEVGSKSRFFGGRAALNLAAYHMDIEDLQVVVTAGSCSSRLVFNVPKARSRGLELELSANPFPNLDVSTAASWNDAQLRSTITSTSETGVVSVVSGIEEGNRLASVPKFQASAAVTHRWPLRAGPSGFFTVSYQHVGSRYTQISDLEPGTGTVDLLAFQKLGGATIGAPLTHSTFTFDPLLPAYNLFNVRVGIVRGTGELAFYVNNVTDERALFALDRERGLRARVGYLTNQPRTFGVVWRFER